MDTRLTYLLTLLPPLPPLGETPPLTLAEALVLLRQQGGRTWSCWPGCWRRSRCCGRPWTSGS